MDADKENNDFVYDVAFSFAGEHRGYVSEVYRILTDKYNIKIFYDQNDKIQAELWGKDLVEEFQKIYGEQSKCCILFISKEYKEKVWTNHEKRSALARAIKEKGDYLLPARFDDTEIPGILSTTGYIDISNMTPDDFSEIVILKLEIPSKQREPILNNSNLPDIRVNLTETSIVSGIPGIKHTIKAEHFLNIKVSNHDILPVFLTYPIIKLKDSDKSIHIITNDFSGISISEIGKLEPGNSFEIYTNPDNYIDLINKLDYVEVTDKIGRKFASDPHELNEAIKKWNKLKSKHR
jgi:hypothetical protein